MLEIGTVIGGKYKIQSVLGRGGMSVVYLAVNEKANKPWAVKELVPERVSGAGDGTKGNRADEASEKSPSAQHRGCD